MIKQLEIMKEVTIYEKRFTEIELTALRMVVENYLREFPDDEEVEDIYNERLDYNHPKYIKL